MEGSVAHWLEPHIDKQIDVGMNISLVIIAKTWRNEEPDIIEGGKVRRQKVKSGPPVKIVNTNNLFPNQS